MSISEVFNVDNFTKNTFPFSHYSCENFIHTDFFNELLESYPICAASTGPTGYSLFNGDRDYDALMSENSAWKKLYATVHSEEFLDTFVRAYRSDYTDAGCVLDFENIRLVDYFENRNQKEAKKIDVPDMVAEDIFIRLDVHQAHKGYFRKNHRDHKRRLLTMLIYFCDQDINNMIGGELVLHGGKKRPKYWFTKTIKAKKNLMAGFLCKRNSYHRVPEIISQSAPRNFIQIQVSSTQDVWSE